MISRLLEQLLPAAPHSEFDIIVVANGCTDETAKLAASFGPCVQVLSIPNASKYEAIAAAGRIADDFPCIYVDADVELRAQDVQALAAALREPGVHAAVPERVLAMAGRPWPVRWYYDVWRRLPAVRSGMFGRGTIAVTDAGYRRLASLPRLLADDLAASLLFADHERVIVPTARVIVHPPRTWADLLRRRVRAATGTAQLEQAEHAPASTARTRLPDLASIVRGEPLMAPRVAFFLAVAVLARLRARRAVASGDYSTWLRDESSRQPAMAESMIVGHSSGQR